jgi:pyrrolidone-carboxylate peptidase
MGWVARAALFALLSIVAGCVDEAADDVGADEDAIRVDTSTPQARRQYDANVAFASSYTSRCVRSVTASSRPRVLVTGFGRFLSITNNATGRIVSALVPEARYPETERPPAGEVDPPEPQLSVGVTTLDVPGVGPVDVCGMILPVSWDLAAILIAKEVDAIRPSFVLMNGVAGDRQALWIELGATNRAAKTTDGSDQLAPATGERGWAKIVESAARSEEHQGNLLSWRTVAAAARAAIERHASEVDGGARFDEIVHGATFAGFPRSSNTYLCNNVTYVTGWLMNHPGREVRLLRASKPVARARNDVNVRIDADLRAVPRVFVHWPSDLAERHHEAAADVMGSIIAAQLQASAGDDPPMVGDNALADPELLGGDFF